MEDQNNLITKYLVEAWQTQLNRSTNLINKLTDDQLLQLISNGRNSGAYLIGHLTAIHDGMLPLIGAGERLYPELEEIFVKNPDHSGLDKPSINDLRDYWNKVNAAVNNVIASLPANEWLTRHSAVSEEEFRNEPHRNKLNILLSRTTHLAYHFGQLALLKR